MTALLEIPDLGLSVSEGQIWRLEGPGARTVWSRLAEGGPALYKGKEIRGWDSARRREAGCLVLFERPQVPAGVTVAQLLRWARPASAARALRPALRENAKALGLPDALIEAPLEDALWRGREAAAEWLQAAILSPELVISAAPTDATSMLIVERLAKAGTAVVLTGDGPAPKDAVLRRLP